MLSVLRAFGFDDFTFNLSTKDPNKYVGTDEIWDQATEALREALDAHGLEYAVKEGDAAFYGPKIDIDVRDAIGRSWQLSTIQCDFNHPERFDLEYVGADNARHRPIMMHRALFGLDRAVLRRAARALRRRVPDVAGAGAGACAAGVDGARGVRREGRRPHRGGRRPRRRGRRRPTRSASGSAPPSSRSCRTCSSSATTTSPAAPSASTRAAARSSAASTSTSSSPRFADEVAAATDAALTA